MDKTIRITKTVNDVGILIPASSIYEYVDSKAPYFKSLYYYPDDALVYAKANKGSIKGYRGQVYTNEITFDIDSKDLEVSRENTLRLLQYLESVGLYNDDAGKLAFSGSKGFHIHINTEHTFAPAELKAFCMHLAKQVKFRVEAGFKIDPQVYNTNRIFRVPNTPHEKSGLFKVEMLSQDIANFSMDEIKEAAKTIQPLYPYRSAIGQAVVLEALARMPKKKVQLEPPTATIEVGELRPCLAAIQAGDMADGESNAGLVRLANHYRKAGLSKASCRQKLVEAGAARHLKYPGANEITLDKINQEVLYPIYSGEGYTFTCNDDMLVTKCGGTCQLKCKPVTVRSKSFRSAHAPASAPSVEVAPEPALEAPKRTVSFRNPVAEMPLDAKVSLMGFKSLSEVAKEFTTFAKESKKFRVETGIKALDDRVRIVPNGLVIINARAGVGKTSAIVKMMKNIAGKGAKGVVYQIDMAQDEFYTKLASEELKISPDDVLDLFYSDDPKFADLKAEADASIAKGLDGIMINYETDLTVDKIESDIKTMVAAGNKPSVIFIDYLQKLRGGSDYHRATENLLKLKSIISRYKVCIVGLSQIPRNGGDEETPIHTAAAAQGGAIYEQNASICINLWRPLKFAGAAEDRVMAFAVSKNRMGECYDGLLYFDGAISELRDMTEDEHVNAAAAMEAYAQIKQANKKARGSFR